MQQFPSCENFRKSADGLRMWLKHRSLARRGAPGETTVSSSSVDARRNQMRGEMLTKTTDKWDYRQAFRSSLSFHDEGHGLWTANTPALDLRFKVEHQRIGQVAVLRISSDGFDRYDFVSPALTADALKDVIEERLVDEILSAYARAPF
jgi:hypothetical protein